MAKRSQGADVLEYHPTQRDLETVAQAIIQEYRLIYKKHAKDNILEIPLTKMLYSIFQLKNQQIQQLKDTFEQQLLLAQKQAMKRNEIDFIDSDDRLRKEFGDKQLKVIQRLIDLKNKKQQQLSRLEQKYNLLLERFNRLENESKQKDALIKTLKKENEQLAEKQAKFTITENQYENKIQKLQEKIENTKTKMQNQKRLMQSYREYLQTSKQSLLEITMNQMGKFADQVFNYIKGLQQKIIKMEKASEEQRNINQEHSERQRRTIKELIADLSIAVRFQRKENQNDEQWLHSYRQFKYSGGLQQFLNSRPPRQTTSYSESPNFQFIKKNLQLLQKLKKRP